MTCKMEIELFERTNVLIFRPSGANTPLNNGFRFLGTSSMASVLGFITDTNATLDANGDNEIVMPYPPDLSGINQVFVHSREVGTNHGLDAGRQGGYINLVECVSLHNVGYGCWGYKQNNDDEMAEILYQENKNLERISIVLRDCYGNKLDIGTKNMYVILKIYFSL